MVVESVSQPVPGDWGWNGPAAELRWDYNSDPAAHNYSLTYLKLRQLGASHEDALQGAQRRTYGEVRSKNPEPESAYNRAWASTPTSSPLPALRAVIEQAEATQKPMGSMGRRMAMRWGVPMAGGLLGLYGLAALVQPREELRQESYAAQGME